MSALCKEYDISRKTGYAMLHRYAEAGVAGLEPRSRRPHSSPRQSSAALEDTVATLRALHPTWGGRKLRTLLQRAGFEPPPSASTVTAILRRLDLIAEAERQKHRPYQRFERTQANELWQMDFKGDFLLEDHTRCHPLTVLDDHSRFLLGLQACGDESRQTVKDSLTTLFRTYGLPAALLADNGSPWGFGPSLAPTREHYTQLGVWLLRLDIKLLHGRPRHPQTQGKDERLHRTLDEELLQRTQLTNLQDCQLAFDRWRCQYNQERPHDALALQVPVSHYQLSRRPFPEQLPTLDYEPGLPKRKVDAAGCLYFANRRWRIGHAFQGEMVALQPAATDGQFVVIYGKHPVLTIDLRDFTSSRDG